MVIDPLSQIGVRMSDYGGLGLQENSICLLYYFKEKKKKIDLNLFAKLFSSLSIELQKHFFDTFLKSYSKNKTEEIDFLYFLCSPHCKSEMTIDEHTIYNLISNVFRMEYNLNIFSKDSFFLNQIVSCFVSLLDSAEKKVSHSVLKVKFFLNLFFRLNQQDAEYSDLKIDFFKKIDGRLSEHQKECIRLYIDKENIFRLDCSNDLSKIEHNEEDSTVQSFDMSSCYHIIETKKTVYSQEFSDVLAPLKWSDEKLKQWLNKKI